jgi:ADP-ribose pyrophosphatase YjhB (NUDIX family)
VVPPRAGIDMREAIRPIAIGIFRLGDRILVGHGHDASRRERYCRPPGGALEFGERAGDALRREVREEIHAEIMAPLLLGVLENTFTLEGAPRHEIAFVFAATFVDSRFYRLPELPLHEAGWDGSLTWEPLDRFNDGTIVLYPEGLLQLLGGAPP